MSFLITIKIYYNNSMIMPTEPRNIINLYNILGLTPDIHKEPNCADLIKKAYIRKAKVWHPNKYILKQMIILNY